MKVFRFIATIALLITSGSLSAQNIIAHRGYHAANGAEENSIAALRAAIDAGLYATEFDLNMTEDGEIVVVHGPWLGDKNDADRLNIQRSDFATIRSKQLKNGEVVPTLDEYLAEAAKDGNIRLVIEIKEHATPQIESDVVRKVVAAVKSHKLQERVEYISFRQHICNELVRLAPANTPVSYLGGNLTPRYVKGLGYTGISYSVDVLKRIPRWIEEAHRLGLSVGIWTVNDSEDAIWSISKGVDYITTDNPRILE